MNQDSEGFTPPPSSLPLTGEVELMGRGGVLNSLSCQGEGRGGVADVGVLLVTHDNLGNALLKTVTGIIGYCPIRCKVLRVSTSCNPQSLKRRAALTVNDLDRGDGVLVFTDIYGSTPANIATSLQQDNRVAVVAGVNLPMLVRVFNSPNLKLPELTKRALSGGHDGVIECHFPIT